MSDYRKYVPMDDTLFDYVLANTTEPDAVQRGLIARTNELGVSRRMQIAHPQAVFMTFLTRSIGARNAIEVGTFTGYSALAIARGLPEDGRLLACDVSEEWTAIAREAWTAAGVADRIDLRIGPALETIAALPPEAKFDLAFIDADKKPFDGSKTYQLHLPPNVPINNFWAVTIYDSQTRSQLQTSKPFPSVGSQTEGVKKNDDGIYDVFFGPKVPAGFEKSWLETVPGKSWRPGEVELVK